MIERESATVAAGSSKGGARIFAPAAYPDESYLEQGLRALERWRADRGRVGPRSARRDRRAHHRCLRRQRARSSPGCWRRGRAASAPMRRSGVSACHTGGRPASISPTRASFVPIGRMRRLLELAGAPASRSGAASRCVAIEPGRDGANVVTDSRPTPMPDGGRRGGPWSRPLLAGGRDRVAARVTAQTVVQLRASRGRAPAGRADGLRRRRAVRALGSGARPEGGASRSRCERRSRRRRQRADPQTVDRARGLGALVRYPGITAGARQRGDLLVHRTPRRAVRDRAPRAGVVVGRVQRPGLSVRARDGRARRLASPWAPRRCRSA